MADFEDQLKQSLSEQADGAIALICKYSKEVLTVTCEKLRVLRDKYLAHKEIAATQVSTTR
jgi:hypothetical protein